VVALDLRGFNLSDKPQGVEKYTLDEVVDDIHVVMRHFERKKVILMGQGWGGYIAWSFAMKYPRVTDRLIVLHMPHPKGVLRELATNSTLQQQVEGFLKSKDLPKEFKQHLTPTVLASGIREPAVRAKYEEAYKRSSLDVIWYYLKANYPSEPNKQDRSFPPVQCPVLMIQGQGASPFPGALNDTWKWVENDLTLVTLLKPGHVVDREGPEQVTRIIDRWLMP
jgi:pimeloyl-ACP methyl ester carboxylesterase